MYFLGVGVKFLQQKVENRLENAQKWIYLFNRESLYPRLFLSKATAKVDTRKRFWSHKASAKLCTWGTFYRTQHVSLRAFIRWGFCPSGLLSVGAVVRRGCCPSGLLSVGAVVRRGCCPSGLLSVGAVVRRGCCPSGLLSVGAVVRRGCCPSGLLSVGAVVRRGYCPSGLLSVGAFVRSPVISPFCCISQKVKEKGRNTSCKDKQGGKKYLNSLNCSWMFSCTGILLEISSLLCTWVHLNFFGF